MSYSDPSSTGASHGLKLYQAFIFSIPIFFTFILLLLFYLFYLRRRRVDWSSLRMRSSVHVDNNDLSRVEMGLKKEVREMLPIIIYKESFSVRDAQCSVCLGDYQAEDKLQQIPACGHTFHMDCIDSWLATHATCPLCRLSLLAPAKAPPNESPNTHEESSAIDNSDDDKSDQSSSEDGEDSQNVENSETTDGNSKQIQTSTVEEGSEVGNANNETTEHEPEQGIAA